jgi:hypothetical protein
LSIISGDICIVQKASQQSLSPVPSIAVNASYEHIISPLQLLALQAGSVANLKVSFLFNNYNIHKVNKFI